MRAVLGLGGLSLLGVIGALLGGACSMFGSDGVGPIAVDAGGALVDGAATGSCAASEVAGPNAKQDASCSGGVSSLEEPTNCGACGHACVDGACTAGRCATSRVLPEDAIDYAHVDGNLVGYVVGTDVRTAQVSFAKGVGHTRQLIGKVLSIAGDSAAVWVSTDHERVRFARGTAQAEDFPPGELNVGGLLAVGESLYFYSTAEGFLYGFTKVGDEPRGKLSVVGLSLLSVAGDAAFWTGRAASATEHTIYTDYPAGRALATTPNPVALAGDRGFAYFADANAKQIFRVSRAGGAPAPLALEPGSVRSIAVDDRYVYWTADRGGGANVGWMVARVGLCGGVPLVLLQERGELTSLSLDADSVYVSDVTRHELVKLPK